MNRQSRIPMTVARRQFLASLALLPITDCQHNSGVRKKSAMWIWKDRILNPARIGKFSQRNDIDTLYLYVTPAACSALLNGNQSALAAVSEMRAENRQIFAVVGEPDWSWGIKEIPEHVALIIELLKKLRIFDGIQFDIEPHSLEDWSSERARAKLMVGLVEFYQFIRKNMRKLHIDAVVNPSYANLQIGSKCFLETILEYADTISIMAYRKGINRAIEWAAPSIQIAEDNNKGWRIGFSVDDEGPDISWKNLTASEFRTLTDELKQKLEHRWPCHKFLGLAYHDYDGLRKVLEKQ